MVDPALGRRNFNCTLRGIEEVKRSGKVAYAVLSFGGVLGFGGSYHPLPWDALTYDSDQGGYVVDVDKDRLKDAPSHRDQQDPFSDPAYGRRVTEYWLILR
jgi:hypothetical protein